MNSLYNNRPNLNIGFHGCDQVKKSQEIFDWLGHGFHVWENNHDRAKQWASDKNKHGQIKKPTVVGVICQLKYCLDFTDSAYTEMIGNYYDGMVSDFKTLGKEHYGFSELQHFDTVRGVFTEGGPAFDGADIQLKNHIQICIRNLNCIQDFFIPRHETKFP